MSARNGDKSRFNRQRKQKIARRKRVHQIFRGKAEPHEASTATLHLQPRSVAA